MNNPKQDMASRKADRLAAIEIADDRTNQSKRDRARNVGAESSGDPGAAGAPTGSGNTLRNGDSDLPLNVDTTNGH